MLDDIAVVEYKFELKVRMERVERGKLLALLLALLPCVPCCC